MNSCVVDPVLNKMVLFKCLKSAERDFHQKSDLALMALAVGCFYCEGLLAQPSGVKALLDADAGAR